MTRQDQLDARENDGRPVQPAVIARDQPVRLDSLVVGGIVTAHRTRSELADDMVRDCRLARAGQLTVPKVIVASNGSVIARFHQDAAFRALLLQADIIDADGMPLVWATRLFCKTPLVERVATTDFIHDAAAAAAREGIRFFFLGAKPGIAEQAAEVLRARYAGLQVVGVRNGYFAGDQQDAVCDMIRHSKADVLWVGMGSPTQEAFAIEARERLAGVAWIRTCGGMFDHCVGKTKRAPQWMQRAGLEWLHRGIQEPRRLGRRYLVSNPVAAYHLATKTHD